MADFQLISQVLRGFWFMEPGAAQGYLPLLNELRAGNFEPMAALFKSKKKENAPYAVALSLEPGAQVHRASRYASFDEAPQGSVAVIPVSGPMMQQDFCGSLGTITLGRLAQEADSHPHIVGHVFVMDTPGGTVAGTERFSSIIKSTQKPAVAFVQGMMASAGYWAGSAANHVMMSGQTAQAGSIGTMLQYTDSSKAARKAGYEQKMVRADASFDKNEAFLQLLAGNDQPVKEQMLNPLNEVFLSAVRDNRAGKLPTGQHAENVLSGKVYLAADAVKYGLADSIGTFEDAVQLALNMASESDKSTPSNTPTSQLTMTFKQKWGALLALAGVSTGAAAETPLTEANLEQLNAKAQEQADQLGKANELVATLTSERDTARTDFSAKETVLATVTENLTKATTDLSEANAKVTTLEAQVKAYGAQPGAIPTNPVNPKALEGPEAAKNPHVNPEAAHNKYAASLFGQ